MSRGLIFWVLLALMLGGATTGLVVRSKWDTTTIANLQGQVERLALENVALKAEVKKAVDAKDNALADLVKARESKKETLDIKGQEEYYRGIFDVCVYVLGGGPESCNGVVVNLAAQDAYSVPSPGYADPNGITIPEHGKPEQQALPGKGNA